MSHGLNFSVHGFFTAVLMGKKRDEIIVCVGSEIYLCVFFSSASLEIETIIYCLRSCFKMYSATKSNALIFAQTDATVELM